MRMLRRVRYSAAPFRYQGSAVVSGGAGVITGERGPGMQGERLSSPNQTEIKRKSSTLPTDGLESNTLREICAARRYRDGEWGVQGCVVLRGPGMACLQY
eukprot:1365482-Rhodomonas_salina.1